MNVTDDMVDDAVDAWHESGAMLLDDQMRKILVHVLGSREAVLERELAEAKADAERGWKDAQERQDEAQAWAQTASQALQMTHSAELRMQRVSGWLSGLIEQEKVAFGDEGGARMEGLQ